MKVYQGIIFNMESERRGEDFVTRKITKWFADYYLNGFTKKLKLGNIEAKRDWNYCPDSCKAMQLIMQSDEPDDYVISSGQTHSVKEFLEECYNWGCCGHKMKLEELYEIDFSLYRPCEVPYLCGDPTKIKNKLGWVPTTTFEELVSRMLVSDIQKLKGN